MQTVHIYVESDSTTPREAERYTGYVLECTTVSGQTVTKECFQKKTGTYNQVILQSLIEAMERINQNCEVHIHTQNKFILDMLERNLPMWAENEFRNGKGESVKNHTLWSRLWESAQKHLLVKEPGTHSYFNWMQDEMTRMRLAAASSIY